MPRSFDFSVDSSISIEQTRLAFADREYWLARLARFGGLGTLDSLTADPDGAVTVVVTTAVRPDGLPGPVAKFFPREWRVVQTETWSPIRKDRMHGNISVVSHGAPISGVGTTLVMPRRGGSQLKCMATVEVRVPMIGGKVESMVGRSLAQSTSAGQRFTEEWIHEHV